MNIECKTINRKIKNNLPVFINDTDIDYYSQILFAAQKIVESNKPVVLLSGPSGSGKTTTAFMIEKFLDNEGHEVHTISLDNYFKPVNLESQDKKLDLESPERVDSEFLNEQLNKIINCEEVDLPKFDFQSGERVFTGKKLKREPTDIILLEGIHSLNPDVITVPDDKTFKIYVSVRTRISDENGCVLHPKFIRLLRRMLRDKNFRNREFEKTISMFNSVQHGENAYIMPYKDRADCSIDTFIRYEANVYKYIIENNNLKIPESGFTKELIEVLNSLTPINPDDIPNTSLIREFIGNGQFEY